MHKQLTALTLAAIVALPALAYAGDAADKNGSQRPQAATSIPQVPLAQ